MADRCAEVAVKTGVVTELEGRRWLDAFREQGAQGPIVAGRLHIFVGGVASMTLSATADRCLCPRLQGRHKDGTQNMPFHLPASLAPWGSPVRRR